MSRLIDRFFQSSSFVPNKTAIWCDGDSITYSELSVLVNQWSHLLKKNGVKYGDHIGVLLPNSKYFVALIFVSANIGVALVPLNSSLPVEAIDKAYKSSDVKHIIANSDMLEKLDSNQMLNAYGLKLSMDQEYHGAILFHQMLDQMPITPIDNSDVTGDEALILTLTSGSTGLPKPIVLTQKNKVDRALQSISLYSITIDDNVLAATPLYHSLAERLVIIPLILGGTSILLSGFSPILWLETVKNQRVTFTIAVSSQLNKIVEVLTSPFLPDITSLRCIVSSSALLENHVKSELLTKLNCDFHECYGTSEIAMATNLNLSDARNKLKSVGKAAPGAEVKILTKDGTIIDHGSEGEIICKTDMLFAGYYKLPDLTEKSMIKGYFRTGDVGYMDEDGFLYYLSREKDIIISGGINIYPSDIESVISLMPSVKECAAFPYPDEQLGEVIAVAVVPNDNEEFNERAAKFLCVKKLADYQQPRKYFLMDQLPRNSMGKLMKFALVELFSND